MARTGVKTLIDFDNRDLKRRFVAWAGALTGIYDVRIEPRRSTRTLKQNAYWHACIVEPFAQFLRDQQFTLSSHEDAHELLKEKFLRVPVADRDGVVIGTVVRSTTSLTPEEFSGLVDSAAEWLETMFGIVVPPADPFHATAGATR